MAHDLAATLIGAAASIASTGSFVPQAWKVIKTRETKDLSTKMYCLTVAGFALWTVYGALIGEWPLIVTNCICLFMAGFILTMKMLPASTKSKVAKALDQSVDQLSPDA
jgi:MtN3 and saliva related transmembrane protein